MKADVDGARDFNTWDSDFPADMVHLPTGVRVSLCAYSNGEHRFTRFPAGSPDLVLGPRTLDATDVNISLAHGGTHFDVRLQRCCAQSFQASWQAHQFGEWGLRFWSLVCVQVGEAQAIDWRYDEARKLMIGTHGEGVIAVTSERAPLLRTYHPNIEALKQEYETEGYWYLDSRDATGPLAVLRFNFEEAPELCYAVGLGTSEAQAAERAREALESKDKSTQTPVLHTGRFAGALDAVRDVVGWNTVFDPINCRPYTSLSRNWSSLKFGGFGVWLDDILYHGYLASLLDDDIARANLRAALAGATEAGNLPCLLTGRDAWVDRSQPPVATFVLWLIHTRWGDLDFLAECYPTLLANHEWWWRERDGNDNGLLEYGTSPVGRGLYRGTKLAAKDESIMDNSPVHDEARLNLDSWTLDCEDVALNSLLALDAQMLAKVADILGKSDDVARLRCRGDGLKTRISEQLWDPSRNVFANRLWSGKFVDSLAPTSFFPLIAGAATAQQAQAMLTHFEDPRKFSGDYMLPSVTRDDPAYKDNVYWRGRVWPPLNFLTYYGLKRYGFYDAAAELAAKSYTMFMAEWNEHRWCAENYNADTGAAKDQPDTDTFYAWGALLAAMAVSEVADADPWGGFEIHHGHEDFHLDGLRTPFGAMTVSSSGGQLSLTREGCAQLITSVHGRLRIELFDAQTILLSLPEMHARASLEVAGSGSKEAKARLNDKSVVFTSSEGGGQLMLDASSQRRALRIDFADAG